MRFIKTLFLLLIVAVFAGFAVVNREAVTLRLFPLPYALDAPLFLVALACFALGALTATILLLTGSLKRHRQLQSARQLIMALENEIGGLKAEKLPQASIIQN